MCRDQQSADVYDFTFNFVNMLLRLKFCKYISIFINRFVH